jgi:hypothetical protein
MVAVDDEMVRSIRIGQGVGRYDVDITTGSDNQPYHRKADADERSEADTGALSALVHGFVFEHHGHTSSPARRQVRTGGAVFTGNEPCVQVSRGEYSSSRNKRDPHRTDGITSADNRHIHQASKQAHTTTNPL